jgi:hypothetical protein
MNRLQLVRTTGIFLIGLVVMSNIPPDSILASGSLFRQAYTACAAPLVLVSLTGRPFWSQ